MKKGEILKKYRLILGLSQKDFAENLNVTSGYISNIETSKKKFPETIKKFLNENFELTKSEINTLGITNGNLDLRKKERELNEKEKLLNNTYYFIRENNSVLAKVASIQNELIDLNNTLDIQMNKIELSLNDSELDIEVLKKLKRPFKTTIKRLNNKIKKLEEMSNSAFLDIDEEGSKRMDLDYLRDYMPPFHALKKEHQEIAVQTWIANNLMYRWKDYKVDQKGVPSPFSQRLWGAGRGTPGTKSYMKNNVQEDLQLQVIGAEDLTEFEEIIREVGGNLIERSVVVAEMLLKDARKAKTSKVRNQYNLAMHNEEFLVNLLRVCVHLYSLGIIKNGQSLECLTLESKVNASESSKYKLTQIWRSYGRGEIEFEEAIKKSDEITEEYQTLTLDKTQLQQVAWEQMMAEMAGETNIKGYMHEIMDKMIQRMTGKRKIFDTKGNINAINE